MACFPKIDSPCPLDADAQRRIAGDCSRCGKSVHVLDALDAAQRTALMRTAAGPLCVSYRLPMALGAALALSMGGQALAADTPSVFEPADTAALSEDAADMESSQLDRIIMVGGITRPDEAEWIDDETLPELPVVVEDPAARG